MTATSIPEPAGGAERGRQRALVALAALVALGLVVAMISSVTTATWTDTTRNNANAWETATVSLTDDDGGVALFSATGMVPGAVVEKTITVRNDSTAPLDVRLYGQNLVNSDAVAPLAPQLNLKVGTSAGLGDVFTGTLAGFATTHSGYASGTTVISLAAGGTRTYHFWVELDGATPQSFSGDSAGIDFVWEGHTQ